MSAFVFNRRPDPVTPLTLQAGNGIDVSTVDGQTIISSEAAVAPDGFRLIESFRQPGFSDQQTLEAAFAWHGQNETPLYCPKPRWYNVTTTLYHRYKYLKVYGYRNLHVNGSGMDVGRINAGTAVDLTYPDRFNQNTTGAIYGG